ncbi:MAG: O-antigen ligase family protein [Nitrospirales bacterium]|nr:O-antigen ligase family protein [Nitrospirales bacterium]
MKTLAISRTALDVPILLFLGWILLTVPFATDWSYSLEEWQKSIPRFLIFWFVVNVVKTEKDIRSILHSFSIGLVLLAILESVHFIVEGGNAFSMKMRAGGLSGSSQWLSCFLVIGIPVLWLGFFCDTRLWVRRLYLLALVMSGVALFLVHTRAAWLAVMTQGFFYMVLRMTRSWIISGLIVFFSVGLLIVFLAIPGQHRELISSSKFTSPRSMLLRFNTWDLATQDIREHPLTGIGYGKHSFYLRHPNLEKSYHNHIHNSFLSSMVQVGIPGFLVLASIFWVVLRKSSEWSQRFSEQYLGNLAFAVFFITVGLIVRLIFDDMLIGNVVYLFMFLLGVCFSLGGQLEAKAKTKPLAEGARVSFP